MLIIQGYVWTLPERVFSFCVIPINIAVKLIYEIFHRNTYPRASINFNLPKNPSQAALSGEQPFYYLFKYSGGCTISKF